MEGYEGILVEKEDLVFGLQFVDPHLEVLFLLDFFLEALLDEAVSDNGGSGVLGVEGENGLGVLGHEFHCGVRIDVLVVGVVVVEIGEGLHKVLLGEGLALGVGLRGYWVAYERFQQVVAVFELILIHVPDS